MQTISFLIDGQKLHGNLFFPEKLKEKNPAILFVHGWTSSSESLTIKELPKALTAMGFICMSFDLRSHGKSEGDRNILSRKNYLADVTAVYDFLIKQPGVNKEKISVVGSSFGAYLAMLLIRNKKVQNLTLRVPANYPNENFDQPQINFSGDTNPDILPWRFKSLDKGATYSLEGLSNFSGNVLIVESEKDAYIPHQTIENYIKAIKNANKVRLIIMKGALHSFTNDKQRIEYAKIVTHWFKQI